MKNSIFFTEKTLPPLLVLILSLAGIVVLLICFYQGIFSLKEFHNTVYALGFAFFLSLLFFYDEVKENKLRQGETKKVKKNKRKPALDKVLGLIVIFLSILAVIFVLLESIIQFLFNSSLIGLR